MNRADLLLSCLRDGRPWTRRDIFERTGQFFMVNNAAVELRGRGLDVRWSRSGRMHMYQLVNGSLTDGEGQAGESPDSNRLSALGLASPSVSDPPVDGPLRERGGDEALICGAPARVGEGSSPSVSSRSLSDPLTRSAPVPQPLSAEGLTDGSAAQDSPRPTGAVHPVPHRPSPGAGQLSLEMVA